MTISGRGLGDSSFAEPTPAWRPLAENAPRILGPGLGDQGILKIGAFGTCGDPKSPGYVSWRHEELFPILEEQGIAQSKVFNPEVAEWKPEDAIRESNHLARDSVIAVAVTNLTASPAGIAEAGLAAFGSVLRGQDAVIYIAEDKDSPANTRVARQLANGILSATVARYPLFTMAKSVRSLSYIAADRFQTRVAQQNSGMVPRLERLLPPHRTDLVPAVYISGTCGPTKPEGMKEIEAAIASKGVPVEASFSEDWSQTDEFTHKLNDAVHLMAITGETDSFGALAELGPMLLHAYMAGQSVGVCIKDHPSDPKSSTNRTRTLVKAHLNRLRADFPELPLFVADDLDQLTIFGLSEFYKQRQRLQLS